MPPGSIILSPSGIEFAVTECRVVSDTHYIIVAKPTDSANLEESPVIDNEPSVKAALASDGLV